MKLIEHHRLYRGAQDKCSTVSPGPAGLSRPPEKINPSRSVLPSFPSIAALLVFLASSPVMSAVTDGDDPSALFDTSRNIHSTSKVTWISVNNIQVTCEREAQLRGYPPFGFELKACSFFENDVCVIFTAKKVNMHTLGHEVRHCFQGWWHE